MDYFGQKNLDFYYNKEEQKVELLVEYDLSEEKLKILKELSSIKYELPMIRSSIIEIKLNDIEKLKRIKDVRLYYAGSPLSARMETSKKLVSAEAAYEYGLSGKQIGIAVLDTGISPIADFILPINRIVAFQDFINYKKNPYDDNGHGTHVSGIAAGNGYNSRGKYAGIAPNANIISVKILDENGQGNSAQALAGIQWIIDNKDKYNIKVANLSIGTNDKTINIPLVKAVNAAWERGIVMVSAAGNTDVRRGTVNSPGISRKIITVGSYEEKSLYSRSRIGFPLYTQQTQWADIYAPGKDIVSCLSPDYSFRSKSRVHENIVEQNYIKMSGTSMATPMVSGAIALLLEKKPFLLPAQVKSMLKESATINQRNGNSVGLLNIENLI